MLNSQLWRELCESENGIIAPIFFYFSAKSSALKKAKVMWTSWLNSAPLSLPSLSLSLCLSPIPSVSLRRKLCHDYRLKRLFSYALLFPFYPVCSESVSLSVSLSPFLFISFSLSGLLSEIELNSVLIEVVCGNDSPLLGRHLIPFPFPVPLTPLHAGPLAH